MMGEYQMSDDERRRRRLRFGRAARMMAHVGGGDPFAAIGTGPGGGPGGGGADFMTDDISGLVATDDISGQPVTSEGN